MKNSKRLVAAGLLSLGLLAGLVSSARADDDEWGRVALGIFLGAPVYSAPVYVAPPPPPPAVEYRYYGPPSPPPGYYQRDHHWQGRGHWEHRDEEDDD